MNNYEIIKTASRLKGLQIALHYKAPLVFANDYAVLFIHGSSFSSELSFGFKMNNYSWMDHLAEQGYHVYALDFLGYGHSDRYPEMEVSPTLAMPTGRAMDCYQDIDKAVELIIKRTGKSKVYLIAHSWGGTVAALYATKFPDKIEKLVLFAALTKRDDTGTRVEIEHSYQTMTPEQRVTAMKTPTPDEQQCQLAPELFQDWGKAWLDSDPLAGKFNSQYIRFPSGPDRDVEDMMHNAPYYNPASIAAPTLLIRGEWDEYPDNNDYERLFKSLDNVPLKKYAVIGKGTHVMHLENSRFQLYEEVFHFLKRGNTTVSVSDTTAIAVIFEVIPDDGRKEDYLTIAQQLKPELEKISGFISIERFQSLTHPEKILSLSFWSDEKAIREWRNLELHREAQSKGRQFVFKDYHLRIARVIRDYGMFDRKEAPGDSRYFHQHDDDGKS
ncbi:alpha/beta fold hydrolase [Pedobacter sp. PACM 27299]|uniref:alpha/beta fold hydrolase n=1 Tax=Pedobacter sp. PACM 27299 TaxID=1727164 RepID=UPI000A9A07A9|nr:alpha/beta fold hydrolase [Pedobacter sp. PACM 27299]